MRSIVIEHAGRSYLVRNGEVFVKLGRKWSGGAVDQADRRIVLAAAEEAEDRYEDGPTMVEAIALAGTQTNRCLGCAAPVDAAPGYGRCQQCHGPYGTGVRVDYARWLALVERISNDGAIFDCWAAGEPRFRIPSYFSPTELAELLGEAAWRLECQEAAR